jgi:erythromycin esterase-like protein
MAEQIERFVPVNAHVNLYGFSAKMVREKRPGDGHWVRYDDHLAALKAERERREEAARGNDARGDERTRTFAERDAAIERCRKEANRANDAELRMQRAEAALAQEGERGAAIKDALVSAMAGVPGWIAEANAALNPSEQPEGASASPEQGGEER